MDRPMCAACGRNPCEKRGSGFRLTCRSCRRRTPSGQFVRDILRPNLAGEGPTLDERQVAWAAHWINEEGYSVVEAAHKAGFRTSRTFEDALERSGYEIAVLVVPKKPGRRNFAVEKGRALHGGARTNGWTAQDHETRRCQNCGRGNALVRVNHRDRNDPRRVCRYCGHETRKEQ